MTSVTILILLWLAALTALAAAALMWWRFRGARQAAEAHFATERRNYEEQKFQMAEKNVRMLELKEALEAEQAKSAALLRNILPARVIADLSEKGESAPERFENVTIFFSDLVDFTAASSKLDPGEVIAELNDIFTEFDRIFLRNHCERIKTIGDAYMGVAGLPEPDPEHWRHVLEAARECLAFLNARNARPGARVWRVRIGINSGSVTGGIVGSEKYIYDVFGDAVNTAARMEQNSEPMKINVSENTKRLAERDFEFVEREPVEVKGKGFLKMFFLADGAEG